MEKMTGMTPVAFTCKAQEQFGLESTAEEELIPASNMHAMMHHNKLQAQCLHSTRRGVRCMP